MKAVTMYSKTPTRRAFLKAIGGISTALALQTEARAVGGNAIAQRPNIIVIFVDDMGYGDVGCFGSEKNRTPHIDQMAAEGMKFTDFYVASSVCTPSRAALLTGCYPPRVSMHVDGDDVCVLFPKSTNGLHPNEVTIAEVLKDRGYKTACIGKWHLGDQPVFLPTRQGFDYFFGIPYSNDMDHEIISDNDLIPPGIPLPLVRNEEVIEAPVDQDTLTRRLTDETVAFIKENRDTPFFVYLPHAMVHWPHHASDAFRGKSANGIYGDVVEEIDWSTGKIIKALKELDIDENTLVIFTSDNGGTGISSNGPLRSFKGSIYEGGMRVPCVVRYPGKIPAGTVCREMCSTMDLLPTLAGLAGAAPPEDRVIDGKDIWPLMSSTPGATTPHEAFFYYKKAQLQCVRSGRWKLHLPLEFTVSGCWENPEEGRDLRLYDLRADIHEDHNVAAAHPEVVSRLLALADEMRSDIGDAGVPGPNRRPPGSVENPKPLLLKNP
jgi:arylsulfatase A-like enzyme